MRKYTLKHTHMTNTFDTIIILHNYIYIILGTAELDWNYSSTPKDASDIHRFSNRKWVLTMCSSGNL